MARKAFFLVSLLLLPLFVAGCGDVMENPTDDPHPPTVADLTLSPGTIFAGGSVTVTFSYADPGADIAIAYLRDKNSGNEYKLEPKENATTGVIESPFPGTGGLCRGVIESFEGAQQGTHTVVLWLEDAEGSVSGLVEASINIVL